jgi:hypothetical protein
VVASSRVPQATTARFEGIVPTVLKVADDTPMNPARLQTRWSLVWFS